MAKNQEIDNSISKKKKTLEFLCGAVQCHHCSGSGHRSTLAPGTFKIHGCGQNTQNQPIKKKRQRLGLKSPSEEIFPFLLPDHLPSRTQSESYTFESKNFQFIYEKYSHRSIISLYQLIIKIRSRGSVRWSQFHFTPTGKECEFGIRNSAIMKLL